MRVALFVTCLAEEFHPRAAAAMVKVLEHLGHEVVFPREQTCCGQPMFNNGVTGAAADLARRMIRVFDGFECVVSPSGSCVAMLREHYPHLLEGEDLAGAKDLAARTFEFTEFLDRQGVDPAEIGVRGEGRVTWHAACHLRGLGALDAPGRFLGKIPGIDLVRADKMEQCCGFGGTFASSYSDISGEMVRDKVACLAATEAETVVSSDTGCTMNIAGRCRRDGVRVRFLHLAELLAEGLGLMNREETGW